MNLGCTGRIKGGFKKSCAILLVGDSSTGKSWFAMTCFAEAAKNPAFDKYEFRFNNAENGMMVDIKKYFGKETKRRFTTTRSPNLENFYYDLDDTLKRGPCIYILDSMDAVFTKQDDDKFEEQKSADAKGLKAKGTMAMAKPKINSQNLPRIVGKLEQTGSILIIIAQTRDNVGWDAMFNPKTRSGGKAMKFFAHVELWLKLIGKIKKKVNDKDRIIGAKVQIDIQKNRLSGWEGNVVVPFMKNYGLDDIGSCIDYLIEEKHWSEKAKMITANDFSLKMKRNELIKHIESNNMRNRLHKIVKQVWKEVEQKSNPKRKPKYS